jgi:hypothetical protein
MGICYNNTSSKTIDKEKPNQNIIQIEKQNEKKKKNKNKKN